MTSNLGQLIKSMKPMSMKEQYAGVLPLNRILKAKEIIADLEQILANTTLQNSCGSAMLRLSKRTRLLKEQVLRSERVVDVKEGE